MIALDRRSQFQIQMIPTHVDRGVISDRGMSAHDPGPGNERAMIEPTNSSRVRHMGRLGACGMC
jgi:hypothetical protein